MVCRVSVALSAGTRGAQGRVDGWLVGSGGWSWRWRERRQADSLVLPVLTSLPSLHVVAQTLSEVWLTMVDSPSVVLCWSWALLLCSEVPWVVLMCKPGS